jgi:hypothetical protein
MGPSVILGRVAFRTAVALWRHRLAVVGGAVIVVAFAAYELTFAGQSTASGGDCADTAMAAITHSDEATARAAFACLGPGMRVTSEEQFVSSVQQEATPGQVSRVADKRTADGGHIVFFTVEANHGPAVGYIVYLDPNGKVARVE